MAELNYVAYHIIEVMKERFPEDPEYVASKAARLVEFKENNPSTFMWATVELDSVGFDMLCTRLKIENDPIAIRNFRNIMHKL